MRLIGLFFDWWGKLTRTKRVRYPKDAGPGDGTVVDYRMVSFMVTIWISMALFLPRGILDYFGILYN